MNIRSNDRLFNQLKGGIYHSTSISGYCGIRATGAILPNRGLFPFSHSQTGHSCCYELGAISLLDLRIPSKRPLVGRGVWANWITFLSNHEPITILLDIDPSRLSEPLQDYDSLQDRLPDHTMVAEAEVCYAGSIPFDSVRRCFLVCARRHTLFRIIPGNNVSDIQISSTEALFQKTLGPLSPPWSDVFNLRYE